MGKQCKVPNCKNDNVKNKISVFGVPKSKEEREKWSKILRCSLNNKSYVCESHFNSSDIKDSFTAIGKDGSVICNYQFKRKLLSKDALPKDNREYETVQKKIKIESDESEINTEELSLVVQHDTENSKVKSAIPLKLSAASEFKYNQIQECTVKPSPSKSNSDPSKKLTIVPQGLRERILSGECYVELPNDKWGIHKCLDTKCIIFSYVEMIHDCDKLVPRCSKQVVFGDGIELFMLDKVMKLTSVNVPTTVHHLQYILKKVDSCKICCGGPKATAYADARLRCAYRDNLTWRHKECPIIISKGTICIFCVNLHTLLTQYITRQSKIKKKEREPMLINKTDDTVNRKRSQLKLQRLAQKEKLLIKLTSQLNDYYEETMKCKEEGLPIKIEVMDLPENQEYQSESGMVNLEVTTTCTTTEPPEVGYATPKHKNPPILSPVMSSKDVSLTKSPNTPREHILQTQLDTARERIVFLQQKICRYKICFDSVQITLNRLENFINNSESLRTHKELILGT